MGDGKKPFHPYRIFFRGNRQQGPHDSPTRFHIKRKYFRTEFFGYPSHIFLILQSIQRTSTVHQQPTRLQRRPYVTQNLTLTVTAHPDSLHTPTCHGIFFFSEHPLAGARHIGHQQVEKGWQTGKIPWITVGHYHVRMSPLRQILQ